MSRIDEQDTSGRQDAAVEQDASGCGQIKLEQGRFALDALVLYKQLLQEDVLKSLYSLLVHLSSKSADVFHSIDLYSSLCLGLFEAGTGLKAYVIEKVLHTENPFTRTAEIKGPGCLAGSLEATVKNDLNHLQFLASLQPEMLKKWIADTCSRDEGQKEAVMSLPSWADADRDCTTDEHYPGQSTGAAIVLSGQSKGAAVSPTEHNSDSLKNLFMQSTCWSACAQALADFHRQWGSGIFSKYRAVVWKQGKLESGFAGVDFPDPVTFADFISYEAERSDIIENTLRFLEGSPANNILLYGDRGTGKSSTVKALMNEYDARGLRVIEVPKKLLTDFPDIIRQLSGRNLKFILFVDDLAFEDNEENYTALKAALEGGLESKPRNVLIYATSNRKHLIKEKFSDRAGLVSGNADDEIRSADTMQEKLSLSDRFGMTVVFSSPDKQRYLEIVEGIIKQRGLEIDRELLHREALKWELWYNGRSPRTARQFADWLEGNISKKG